MSVLDNMQQTFFSKVLFILSATLFCYDVSLIVKCLSMPSSRHSCRKGSLVYSPLLSERSILIFLLVIFSMFFFYSTNNSRTFLCAHGIYPTSPRVIIYKRHQIMIISNRCRLGRSLDICVNIIQNLLGAMSCDAKSHLGLLSDDVMFTKF